MMNLDCGDRIVYMVLFSYLIVKINAYKFFGFFSAFSLTTLLEYKEDIGIICIKHGEMMSDKARYILLQLLNHLPFSVFGVMLALLTLGFLTFLAILIQVEAMIPIASGELFHLFHAAHVLLSAVATTAMFAKHDKNLIKAIIVGFVGSIAICGISDTFFPFVGGLVIGTEMNLHICLVEEPLLIYPFAVIGTLAGLAASHSFEKATEYSHSMHVFVSSVASILYLLAYGLTDWLHAVTSVFVITIVAVMIPCCLSDIAFPLACSHSGCTHGDVLEHDHS